MKTNNISREYKIDYISEKIIVTKKFLKAAGVYNSPEYKLMKELRADYPAFAFEEKKIDKKAGKVTVSILQKPFSISNVWIWSISCTTITVSSTTA